MLSWGPRPDAGLVDLKRTVAALAVLTAVALGLRLWGLGFGLPFAYHVDEALFNNVARLAEQSRFRDLAPSFSAFQLLVIATHRVLGVIDPVLRALPLGPEIIATLDSPTESYNLAARVLSATLGAATVIPLFLLGSHLWNRQVGLLAAAFLATCYIHVRDSHFGVPEATVCFFTVLAAYFCSRLHAGVPFRRYLLAGVTAGLAVGSKQLAWPIFVTLALFHIWAPAPSDGRATEVPRSVWLRRVFDWNLWVALLAGMATYVLCVPQMLLKWAEFSSYWRTARIAGARGGMDRLRIEETGPFGTYLDSLRWGLGDVLLALAVAGVALALLKPASTRVRLLFVFPVLYFAFLLLPGHMYFARYTIPAVPFLLLAAAAMVWQVMSHRP